MNTFEPKGIARARGQVLYRYRPGQTFDHSGFIGQVVSYANDDGFQEPRIDRDQIVEEAMNFIRRWRLAAKDLDPSRDGAPEFPPDEALAATQYEVVVPGKVFCRVWPLVMRCGKANCGRIWEAEEPRIGAVWPPACPTCSTRLGSHQLQFLFVHECGSAVPCLPPRRCHNGHDTFRLNDRASRFIDFRWVCMQCSVVEDVRFRCPSPSCGWPEPRSMSLQVHTASSAFAGHGVTIVNVRREEHAKIRLRPEFVTASIARWLGECSEADFARIMQSEDSATDATLAAMIDRMESAGLKEDAAALRKRFIPVDIAGLRERVDSRLGFDPDVDPARALALSSTLETYEQVRGLRRITIKDLIESGPPKRRPNYTSYPAVLRNAGFDPDQTALVTNFPVTYVATGYSRGSFEPQDADLVPYRGRAGRGEGQKTLLFANPVETEALVFGLDRNRVARWIVSNAGAGPDEVRTGSDVPRWFASRLAEFDGRLPPPWSQIPMDDPSDPIYGPQLLFRLLHSVSHQMLRALAVDSGFSETGLSEYMFPFALAFAIYPNGGSEFTIGGLRTVLEQNLDEIVVRGIENDTCLYDPNCLEWNRGADHGCLQLPETACQCWNWFLSRWELFGESRERIGRVAGYWEPHFAPIAREPVAAAPAR